MTDSLAVPLISKNGVRGKVITQSRLLDDRETKSVVFEGGQEATVQSKFLKLRADGTYYLDQNVDPTVAPRTANPEERSGDRVIPVIQEQAYVTKRKVQTGRVQVRKTVNEEAVTIDEPRAYEEYEIRHVPINRIVEAIAPTRVEGDTTILSVYEEETFAVKRLVLKEEVHLIKKQRIEHSPRTITLRKEAVAVERFPASETSEKP